MALTQYDWIIALISIAFCCSSFGNGANDVANSYATSVAARTLTMPQVGILSMCTEFIGAVALGARVTNTIKNGIIDVGRFNGRPGVLILGMACAEFSSAGWLLAATRLGFPVSTTQTIVGALIGVGIAAEASIKWEWESGSVSQVAASWAVAPGIAACFSALVFATIKFGILERQEPFKWAMRLIPFYLSFTSAVLALFIVVEAPTAPSLEEFGAGSAAGIILGVFFGVLAISYVFFVPFFHRKLTQKDPRVKLWHLPLGPLLYRESPPLYWPGRMDGDFVKNYYEGAYQSDNSLKDSATKDTPITLPKDDSLEKGIDETRQQNSRAKKPEPEERFLGPTQHLSFYHPGRLWSYIKYYALQGVTRDCITHSSEMLQKIHGQAKHYDLRCEHLFTYAQVTSAMLMSIAHGSNDVSNAVGPWSSAYATYRSGFIDTESGTPIWALVIAGFLLGAGFWFFGFHIIKSLGNRITQMSPSRGYSVELGAAITVLLASRLSLPVSTTQCLVGATMGVALMNFSLGAANWRQLLFIFCGWVLTLPCAGLIAGLLMTMSLNTPHF